jgi:YgiT-type zinc finger domain-containing protein
MIPFKKCPVCNGEVVEKEVEKLLRGGNNTAFVKVKAEVCLHCGERFYSKATINEFQEIRLKLERQEISEFELLGKSFKVGSR